LADESNAGISPKVTDIYQDEMADKQSIEFHSKPDAAEHGVLKH